MKHVLLCSISVMVLMSTVNARAQEPVKSMSADQTNVELTIYNADRGLVKDTRTIRLDKGIGTLHFIDVASAIMPETVCISSRNNIDFTVLEQNYEYDLIEESKLLDKYVGKSIKLLDRNEFQNKVTSIDAILLSNNQGPIYKINNEIYCGYPGLKVLPAVPDDLIAEPTLVWLYDAKRKASYDIETTYMTQGISWKADYVVMLNADDTKADMTGWVTLDNRSGTSYKNAQVKLVAGAVNQVSQHAPRAEYMMMAKAGKDESFSEEQLFEYHMYSLMRPTTVKNNQTKQVELLRAANTACMKEMVVQGNSWYYLNQNGGDIKQPVRVNVIIKNTKDNKLGIPVPAGIMRLYKKDKEGKQQFIGEDTIAHTPQGEEIKVFLGEAFDVVATRTQTDFRIVKNVLKNRCESAWEVSIRNRKKEPVTVLVVEPLQANWEMLESSHKFTKKDAFTIQFAVTVKPDQEEKIHYRIGVDH